MIDSNLFKNLKTELFYLFNEIYRKEIWNNNNE